VLCCDVMCCSYDVMISCYASTAAVGGGNFFGFIVALGLRKFFCFFMFYIRFWDLESFSVSFCFI
jgi:hypothetical protein